MMSKMESENRQRAIDKIAVKATEQLNSCTKMEGSAIMTTIYSVVTHIEKAADTIGISRDVLLLVVSNSILEKLISEAGCSDKKQNPPTIYKPPKDGYLQ